MSEGMTISELATKLSISKNTLRQRIKRKQYNGKHTIVINDKIQKINITDKDVAMITIDGKKTKLLSEKLCSYISYIEEIETDRELEKNFKTQVLYHDYTDSMETAEFIKNSIKKSNISKKEIRDINKRLGLLADKIGKQEQQINCLCSILSKVINDIYVACANIDDISCEDCIGLDWFNKSQAITDFNKLKNGDSDHIISILDEYDIDLNDVKYFF